MHHRTLLGGLSALLAAACAAAPSSSPPGPPPSLGPVPASGSSAAAAAQEGTRGKRTSGEHTHHLALALGAVLQSDGDAARFGFEYETDWPESWGLLSQQFAVGFQVEIDSRPVDQLFLAPQLSYHPVPQMRLVLAPGVGLRGEGQDNVWILRTGAAWEFEFGHHWSVAPEVFVDIEDGGENNGVLALALGYAF
jgi:hypothetical protein